MCLVLGEHIESIAIDAFGNPDEYDKGLLRHGLGGIERVIVHEGTILDKKVQSDSRYYKMCKKLELIKKLEFCRFYKTANTWLPYDYDADMPPPLQNRGYVVKTTRGSYKHWSEQEKEILKQLLKQANSEKELYELATNNGIHGSSSSITNMARTLGWKVKDR